MTSYFEIAPKRPPPPGWRPNFPRRREISPPAITLPAYSKGEMYPMNKAPAYPAALTFLGRYQTARRKVEWLRRQIFNLRRLTTDTSVHLTDMPHCDSPDQQKLLTILAEIDDLERQIPEAEREAERIRLDIGAGISRIENQVIQDILYDRYLDGKT